MCKGSYVKDSLLFSLNFYEINQHSKSVKMFTAGFVSLCKSARHTDVRSAYIHCAGAA